jgi:hypothetical protein
MNRLTFRFLFLIITLSCSCTLYAGTWMRSEKEGRYSGDLTYDTATAYWDQSLHRVPLPCETQNWALSQSYEYGWSYYSTLFGSVDLRDRNCGTPISSVPVSSAPNSHASGVADVQLGMRGRLNIYRNGRTWEMSAILPTGYPTNVPSRLGNGLYAFKIGAYGRFLDEDLEEHAARPTLELGSDVTIWEGVASKQLHAYTKVSLPIYNLFTIYGAGSADVALTNRSATYNPNTNAYRTYGYDRLSGRVGISANLTKTLRISLETANVLWGRNTNDTTSYSLFITRNFKD